jgi:hypothetical protein
MATTTGNAKENTSKFGNRADLLITHALLRLDVVEDCYWDCLDHRYFGKDTEARVKLFYEALAISDREKVIAKEIVRFGDLQRQIKGAGFGRG